MGAYSKRLLLWFCISILSLVLVGVVVSCDADAESSSGGGTGKTGGGTGGGTIGTGEFSDITATYHNVGDDCDNIDEAKQLRTKGSSRTKATHTERY